MANKIFQALAKEKFDFFKSTFAGAKELFWDEDQSRLRHPGEFGSYRETIVKDLLRLFIPGRYEIDTGFVISSDSTASKVEREVFIRPNNDDINSHLLHFVSGLVMGVRLTTILSPDIASYLTDQVYYGPSS